ncbi:MAG: hypothetical protein ACK5MY_19045 [Jhaorihella sp.]
MDQLTPFERGLLEQFRRLASEFDQSQSASEDLSGKLADWSRVISKRQSEIEARLTQIEATQKRLTDILATQNSSTTRLVDQVNRLLSALKS